MNLATRVWMRVRRSSQSAKNRLAAITAAGSLARLPCLLATIPRLLSVSLLFAWRHFVRPIRLPLPLEFREMSPKLLGLMNFCIIPLEVCAVVVAASTAS